MYYGPDTKLKCQTVRHGAVLMEFKGEERHPQINYIVANYSKGIGDKQKIFWKHALRYISGNGLYHCYFESKVRQHLLFILVVVVKLIHLKAPTCYSSCAVSMISTSQM